MPWSQTSPMDHRTRLIADYLRESLNITELCDLCGISRKTGYKWIDRYLRTVEAFPEVRRRHPTWGEKKISIFAEKPGSVHSIHCEC